MLCMFKNSPFFFCICMSVVICLQLSCLVPHPFITEQFRLRIQVMAFLQLTTSKGLASFVLINHNLGCKSILGTETLVGDNETGH